MSFLHCEGEEVHHAKHQLGQRRATTRPRYVRAKTIDASRYEWKDVSEEGKKFRIISVLPTFL